MICDLTTNIVMLFCFCVLFRAVFFFFLFVWDGFIFWLIIYISSSYSFSRSHIHGKYLCRIFISTTPRWRIFVQWWFSELSTSSSTCSVRHQSSNRTLPDVFSISDSLSVGQLYISFEELVIWLICSHSPIITMIHFRFISKLSGSMC